MLSLLPLAVQFCWVRGHQDRTKDFRTLSQDAQLNVHADSLANAFQHLTDPNVHSKPLSNPFPSCRASLLLHGGHVTSPHKQLLRAASLLPPLKEYTLRCNQWTPDTWDLIHWDAHRSALHALPPTKHLQIAKFIHHWLPVGHRLHKMRGTHSAACPLCQAPDETIHFATFFTMVSRNGWTLGHTTLPFALP